MSILISAYALNIRIKVTAHITYMELYITGKNKVYNAIVQNEILDQKFHKGSKYGSIHSRQKCIQTVNIVCDWCLWPIERGWVWFLLAHSRRNYKPIINNLFFQRTYMKNVTDKYKVITAKKLWTRYDIFDHQEQIWWDI